MMKITQLKAFLLLCFLAFFGVFPWHAAQAAITGKVGVGTWNTQAEFTDIKVVKAGTTLYQSNFTTGVSGVTTVNGTWGVANGNLQQTGAGTPALAFVGESTWSDYTLTLRARKISGDEGFLIALGSPGDATTSWWNIGGFGNTRHLLQLPGFSTSDVNGAIQTGAWYDIKVQLFGNNIRCYLNGALIHDATRMLDTSERTARFNTLINSPGFALLNGIEQAGLRDLAGRDVWIGLAARATFDAMPSDAAYAALTPAQQALIIRKVNKNRMTWNRGWGFDGTTWRDGYITDNMDQAVWRYNSLGVFDKHLTANNSPGTPTADGGYDGQLRFGSQMTVRCCIHEINHALGTGTYWRWGQLIVNGQWTGYYGNKQLADFDGVGAVIGGDAIHFWNYGMLYDQDYSWENARRSILLMAAMRRDMGLADQVNWNYDTNVPSGAFSLVPRHVPSKVLEVYGLAGGNAAPLQINALTGASNQQFQFDLQPEGTYRIRTVLPGNRAVELPGGNTDNGTPVKLWDDNNYGAQRWFMIPTDGGWYKIAPFFNNFKGIDVAGVSTADGAAAQSWDYLDGFNQQWKLVPTEQLRPTTNVADGTYTLTPRHAQDKVLEVYGFNGANGDAVDIWTANGGDNQKFLLDKQTDGTYRLRTKLSGNRTVALAGSVAENGTKLVVTNDDSSAAQRWNLIPTDNGWFKIAPKNDLTKSVDVEGISTANGARVQNWDYLGGNNQQWKLTPTGAIFNLSSPTYTVAEGAGAASVTVTRSGNTTIAASVTYTTSDGKAIQPADYTKTSGSLEFAANETSKTITVPIINDNLDETDETFTLILSNPQGEAILGNTFSATLIITDDDNATPVISSVVLAPQSPSTNSQLICTYNATDAENDALTATYVWKKNGVVLSGESGSTLDLSKTGNGDKGETITVTVSVSDGTSSASQPASVTIGNMAPSISGVTLTPTSATILSRLTATVAATDADNDTLTYSYIWKKNGVVIPAETGSTLDLSKPGNGTIGDSITVTCTATDGAATSESVTSTPVKVAAVPNSSPRVVSVLPSASSDQVGAKRTFAVRAMDSDGASDIESVWLLINDRLNWSEGATFIYVPSAQSPTRGLLYLRGSDDFLAPVTVGDGTNSDAVLANDAVSVVAKEVTVSVVNTTISLTLPLTIREGLSGQNTLFARTQDQQHSVDSASLEGDAGYIRCGTYTVTSQIEGSTNTAPTVSPLSPSATSTTLPSTGLAATPQTFVVQVGDAEGVSDLDTIWFLAGKSRSWGNSVTFVYVRRTKRLYLRSDDGLQWLGGEQIGTMGILENSQVRLDLSTVQAITSEAGKTLSLNLPLQAKTGALGSNKIWLRVQDASGATTPNGDDQGYILGGTWNVTQSAAPKNLSTRSNGNS